MWSIFFVRRLLASDSMLLIDRQFMPPFVFSNSEMLTSSNEILSCLILSEVSVYPAGRINVSLAISALTAPRSLYGTTIFSYPRKGKRRVSSSRIRRRFFPR